MDKTGTLVGLLLERIESGEYPAGEAVPSERQLGEELGLSRTTIRRAIDDLVQRGRLQRQPGRGTYVTGGIAPAETVAGAQRIVSVIIPTFSNPYYGEMVNGIEKEARRYNLRVMVGQSEYSTASESSQVGHSAADPTVCGALVVPNSVEQSSSGVQQFLAAGKPLVYIGRWPKGANCDGVCVDYRMAAQQAVEHLIGLGHQRIAYVEGLPHLPGFSPYDGYADVLRERKLAIKPELVRSYDLPSEAAGQQSVADLVSSGAKFTAIFARNDVTAMGVIQGLRQAGLRVPQDVSVVSIANSLWSRSLDPPLTSVNPHPGAVGQLAMRMLCDRLEGAYAGPAIRTTVTPDLIVRASTAEPS
ncbi:MAG: GntR family transcriptional regulator [Hyphomicrobiales bacterium]|jgi:DNA-binding LacI/PurR family transcriptional regulator|nr:MAG: GntR family transcriptional regulator [Hyphomicrobiales bacterium]